ncbi:hypothetical protein FKM82_001343 [Ascaphus truei]
MPIIDYGDIGPHAVSDDYVKSASLSISHVIGVFPSPYAVSAEYIQNQAENKSAHSHDDEPITHRCIGVRGGVLLGCTITNLAESGETSMFLIARHI